MVGHFSRKCSGSRARVRADPSHAAHGAPFGPRSPMWFAGASGPSCFFLFLFGNSNNYFLFFVPTEHFVLVNFFIFQPNKLFCFNRNFLPTKYFCWNNLF